MKLLDQQETLFKRLGGSAMDPLFFMVYAVSIALKKTD
jgi:hypothetical protein